MAASTLTHDRLAQALLDSVRERPWHEARDRRRGGLPFTHPPGLDLAVAVFPRDGAAAWANVLFSREHPEGIVAQIDGAPARSLGDPLRRPRAIGEIDLDDLVERAVAMDRHARGLLGVDHLSVLASTRRCSASAQRTPLRGAACWCRAR